MQKALLLFCSLGLLFSVILFPIQTSFAVEKNILSNEQIEEHIKNLKRFKAKKVTGGNTIEKEYVILEDGKTVEIEDYKASFRPTVFNGYVQNVNYENPEIFLDEGRYMVVTERVKKLADKIDNNKDLNTIKQIWKEVNKIPRGTKTEKFEATADEILAGGHLNGCGHYAVLFASIARYKGIPSVQVHTLKYDHVDGTNRGRTITGHVFVEVFIEDKWYLVDSTAGKIFLDYDVNNFHYDDGYYLLAKSIDNYDANNLTLSSMRSVINETYLNNKDFKWEGYKQPKYQYIDIRTNSIRTSRTYK